MSFSYPFVGSLVLDLWHSGELPNVRDVLIEPRYGHVARLVYDNGAVRMIRNGRVGVNSNSASEIAKDKGYTKFFLRELGYNTPHGELILMPQYQQQIASTLAKRNPNALQLNELDATIQQQYGYPCYVKSNIGTQGRHVFRCETWRDVEVAIAIFERDHVDAFLVEQAIDLPDYRVVVWRDRVIACYRRVPLAIIGDGVLSISHLITAKFEQLHSAGRSIKLKHDDQRITTMLERQNVDRHMILPVHARCVLVDVANLSLGGEAEDWTERMHEFWRDLCVRVTADLGLQLCGVDLACADLIDPDADYTLFELNAAPGMEHYAALGHEQAQRVRALYRAIFNEYP